MSRLSKPCVMLTVDPSTTASGYAVFFNGVMKEAGVIKFNDKDINIRVDKMILSYAELFAKYKPDICIAEGLTVFNDIKSDSSLSDLCGGLRTLSLLYGTWFDKLFPVEWRKLIADEDEVIPTKRDDCKPWDIEKAKKYFCIFRTLKISDDMADALLIGQAYINLFGNDSDAIALDSEKEE